MIVQTSGPLWRYRLIRLQHHHLDGNDAFPCLREHEQTSDQDETLRPSKSEGVSVIVCGSDRPPFVPNLNLEGLWL